jgi:uncharacterized membrane protein YfcA
MLHIVQTLSVFTGIFAAGMVSGTTGMAFPLIAGPIFLLIYAPPKAVALTAMCSLTGQVFSIALLRRSIDYELRLPLIAAGLVGVPLGTVLLNCCDHHLVRVTLGGLIVISALWGLLQKSSHTRLSCSRLSQVLVGLSGGLTGGLVGASSVVPALWYATRGLSKQQQRAITQPYIIGMQMASLLALRFSGALDQLLVRQYLYFLLPLLAGVGIGVVCFHAVSSSAATRLVMSVVAVSGIVLLVA